MGLGIDELISSLHVYLACSGVGMFQCKHNCGSGDFSVCDGAKGR
jgi:hypothetical protein